MKYSILVNTCDKFEDCWEPFFKLFSFYWPGFQGTIYLNTECKSFSYGNLNIVSLKVCEEKQDKDKITWSECLKRALSKIDDSVILYMQEDYFIKDYVKNELVEEFVALMQLHSDIHCIHLTDQAVKATYKAEIDEKLWVVDKKQRYRISCQAALWRRETLLSYLKTYENAWQFEEFGSKRSATGSDNFYAVDKNWVMLNQFEIIPYVFTGIVQGRWKEEVVPLFEKHAIPMDFSKRGYVSQAPKKQFEKRVLYKLKKFLVQLRYILDYSKNQIT